MGCGEQEPITVKGLLLYDFPTSYVIQQHVQHSHGEGGLFGGETGLFCPPETTDVVIQQGSFLHTCPVVLEAKNLFYFSRGNFKKEKGHISNLRSTVSFGYARRGSLCTCFFTQYRFKMENVFGP